MQEELPLVSILVLNYNGKEYLSECLQSLLQITYPAYEIIVVDNGSVDGSVEYVNQYFPKVNTLALDKNYGFSQANNRGAEVAKGELLVFLNNDTAVEKEWLTELVKGLQFDPKVAVCGSKVVFYSDPGIIDFAGGLISPIGAGVNIGFSKPDGPLYNKTKYSSHAYGASMLVRKDVFQKLGGFDNDYFSYHEELDLCWRCWLQGYKVLYVPLSIVKHKRSVTSLSEKNWKNSFYNAQKSQIQNILKNFNFMNLVKGLAVNFCFDIFRTCLFVCRGKFGGITAIWEGNIDVIKKLPHILEKRAHIQSLRVVTDNQLIRMGLIASLGECLRILLFRRGGFYFQ